MSDEARQCCRIVITGGPGGGKTTAGDLFRRELEDEVVLVPEAATMLFSGGFPRRTDTYSSEAIQNAIYHVQRNLEDVYRATYPGKVLLCDRGTVDGAAYWPADKDSFFASFGTTLKEELLRYDAVIFFESAAVGGMEIESGNPVRSESCDAAALLDSELREIWGRHPNFHFVPHNKSFVKKIMYGLETLESVVRLLTS